MIADYTKFLLDWCKLKVRLFHKERKVIFKQGDVWWCSLGLPLTRQEKQGTWYVEITVHNEKNWIMLNQARILDKKRLTNRVAALDSDDYQKVKERFLKFYDSEK